jgi:AcrR family transcriptional regulator
MARATLQTTTLPRDRMIDAATELFAEHGFDDVTMAEIADLAGVSRATVFNYFRSKPALLEAITERVLDFYRDMLDGALADELTPTGTLLRELCRTMAQGITAQRRLHRGVFQEIARIQLGFDASAVAARANHDARVRLLQLMNRGQARGDLASRPSADALADAFAALVNGTITNWLFRDARRSLANQLDAAVEVFLSPIEHVEPTRRRKATR